MSQNHQSPEKNTLAPKQEKLIAELVAGKSIRDAAKSIAVDERTVYRWQKQTTFQKEYNEQKTRAYNEKLDTLRSGIAVALKTLLTHMTSADTRPYVQVAAASKWLDMAVEIHKMQELEARIVELEEKLKAGNK
jgi:DNA-binding transcriptional MerR regulator